MFTIYCSTFQCGLQTDWLASAGPPWFLECARTNITMSGRFTHMPQKVLPSRFPWAGVSCQAMTQITRSENSPGNSFDDPPFVTIQNCHSHKFTTYPRFRTLNPQFQVLTKYKINYWHICKMALPHNPCCACDLYAQSFYFLYDNNAMARWLNIYIWSYYISYGVMILIDPL